MVFGHFGLPRWLLFGSDGRVDVEMGVDEEWVNSWSIAGVPCKHINILFEKFDQLFLLSRGQLCPYLEELLQGITNDHLLQVLAFCLLSRCIKGRHRGL